MIRTYNPLSVDELGRNAVRALLDYPCDVLPPHSQFNGAGVYTIHYTGCFPAYSGMCKDAPIYVGKADPPGKRLGGKTSKQADKPTLHGRLSEHATSIEAVDNLSLVDFCCRWLVLDPVWIELTEQVLISQYRPVWNVILSGFGIHDPGSGRRNQRRSLWDTLHPGRDWARSLRNQDETVVDILSRIQKHLSS